MKYTQLTLSKRYHISALKKQGFSQKEIAKEVGVHSSTISRELRRNNDGVRGYEAESAQVKVAKREKHKKKRSCLTKQNVPSKEADVVKQALIKMLQPIKAIAYTITSDNGKEFAYHKEIAKALNIDFYFANPYHS